MAVIFLLACNGDRPQRKNGAHHDLKQYFEGEMTLIKQSGMQLRKQVALNGLQDSTLRPAGDSAQLQDLLKPFLDVDINKPSLRDAYDTAAVTDQFSGRQSIVYTARNKTVNPQQIILDIDDKGRIISVNINNHTRNLVYEYRQNLIYQHLKNIHITTYQKIAFLQPRELDIRVLLEPKN